MGSRGFTLVELLVTVAIIAVITAVSAVAYSQVLKGGRDAKRISDLKTIQTGLEQYRVDQGFYPSAINFATDVSLTNATGQTAVTVTKTYIKELPHDPKAPTNDYRYTPSPAPPAQATDYCLYAALEDTANVKDLSTCANITNYTLEASRP